MIHSLRRQWDTEGLRTLHKPIVVAAIFVLAAVLGARATPRLVMLAVLALGGPVVFVVLVRQPAWGLLALIPVSLLLPLEIGTGTETSLNATMLLLAFLIGVWGFDSMVRPTHQPLVPSKTVLPALAFAVVAVLAFINGNIPWFAFSQPASLKAQAGGLAVFLLSIGAFLLMSYQIRGLCWLQRLTWLFLALGGVYIAGQLLPGRLRLSLFTHGSTRSLFWVWLVALAFSQAAFNRRLALGWRLTLGALVLGTLYVSFIKTRWWVSGWLPPLVAIAIIVWVAAPRKALLITAAAGLVLAFSANEIVEGIMASEDYSALTRWEAWRVLAQIIRVNPVLGLGPANYYHYTPFYPILGWYVHFSSHNQYIDIVAQTGIVGLVCFLWFMWEVGWLGWRMREQVPDGFAQAYVVGALGGLGGMLAAGMLGDWVIPFVYNVSLNGMRSSVLGWVFLGGLVVLETSLSGTTEQPGEPGRVDHA